MIINNKRNIVMLALSAALSIAAGQQVYAQTNLEVFGQNRIQYRKFDWRVFETKHFKIYHYDAAGRNLARYVSEQVENDVKMLERKLGGEFPNRVNIMVYNSYDEYLQTNIGRKYDTQLQGATAGKVDIVGDKLVVYYTGVHTDLRRQTRMGMARVLMERIMFGESFREMVKNAVLMNLPTWTVDGFIAYLVDGWDTKANTDWNNMLQLKPNVGFYEHAEANPELAGKAFWKFISDKYGDNTVKTLLYNMQLKGNLNQGIKMTMGYNVKEAYKNVLDFYRDVYARDARGQQLPADSTALLAIDAPKDNKTTIRNVRVSPAGRDVAYVEWKDGEYRVYMQRTSQQQERSLLLEGGRLDYNEQADPDYPLMAWSNNGYKLAIVYRKGKQTRLRIYNSLKAQIQNYIIPQNRFDRLTGVTFLEEDTKLLFSAIKKSQTDLYEFTIKGSKMTNITNDAWDDVQPWYVSGGSRKGILFLSNRPEPNLNVPLDVNELPTGPMNVFFYNTTTKRKELVQMSHVTTGNVSQPIQYGPDNYAYLYDVNGIRNKFVVVMGRDSRNMDSAYAVPITNYPQNIVSHQYNAVSNQSADVIQLGDQFKVHYSDLQIPGQNVQPATLKPTILLQSEMKKKNYLQENTFKPNAPMGAPASGSTTVSGSGSSTLKSGNVFQTEFSDTVRATTRIATGTTTGLEPIMLMEENGDTVKVDSSFLKMRAQPYRHAFRPDFFSVRVDNSVLFNRYQSVAQNGGAYTNPSLGGMLTVSLDDKMENHRFTGGLRLPINFSGTTYFLQYENFRNRIDWGVLFLRSENYNNYLVDYKDAQTGRTVFTNEQLGKTIMTMVQGSASYPLDRIRSVRFNFALREDKLNFKAQDTFSLSYEPGDRKQYWALSRLEYVFDNSLNPATNIYNGFRYKFFTEYLYRMNNPNGGFYNFGTDFRYYKKIYKNFIFATRLAAAHSGGNQKIVYMMGGVDNWINSKYSEYVPLRPTENYAFQTVANNMRGYEQNSRNGNTYAVTNLEFRLPIVSTFSKRPIQSSLIRDLQFVAFADGGSAWSGFWPNAATLRNDKYLPLGNDPNATGLVTLRIEDETGGFCFGYGGGLRTSLFGYFLRVDAAWNIEGRPKPLWHLSIGTDF
ncbi:MAG: hypothetical protein EOP56_04675 [Sphingobacteriales bacterium]|nr:MAG: hypothetical protein EOP56_04675 [Sphingobacteriales bacterium]